MGKTEANTLTTEVLLGKIILIVEDDEFIFSLLEVMLKNTGVDVIHADNGEEALALLDIRHFDLVLLDVRLPGQNGFEIFEKIRKFKKNIPVVAQTANCIPEEKKKFLAAGFADYLEKPIDAATITQLMVKLIGSRN